MVGELTRRQFLKGAISKTGVLTMASVGFSLGEGLNFNELFECDQSTHLPDHVFLSSFARKSRYIAMIAEPI
jgi:hypothetical protein